MIADAHLDLLLELSYREHRLGEQDVFARTWLPLLEAGGVALQVCPIFVDLERQPEGTLRDALGQATSFASAVRENDGRVAQVRGAADLDTVERGDRIGLVLALEGVEPFGYDVPDGCPVVSYAGTLLPGLVDAHVHLVTDSGPEALTRVAGYTDEEIDDVVTEALRRHLAAGVTTVRDLGDRRYTVVERRDRSRSPSTPEPRIVASGHRRRPPERNDSRAGRGRR